MGVCPAMLLFLRHEQRDRLEFVAEFEPESLRRYGAFLSSVGLKLGLDNTWEHRRGVHPKMKLGRKPPLPAQPSGSASSWLSGKAPSASGPARVGPRLAGYTTFTLRVMVLLFAL